MTTTAARRPPSTDQVPTAGARERIGLAVLALPCLLITMDLTVLFLAVPSLTESLRPTGTELLWITDVYGFMLAGALIVMGNLGDRLGRRRLLLAGAIAFGVASVLAALSSDPGQLIAARGIQGVAAAAILPSTMALVFTMFRNPQQRTAALGMIMASFALGGVVGPLLGGAVLEAFEWPAVFLLNVPVMVLLLVLGPRFLPESRAETPSRVELTSATLSVAAVIVSIYGIKQIAVHGWELPNTTATAVGLALATGFVVRQLRIPDPLVDVRLFARRTFTVAFAAAVSAMFATYGMVFFTAQYFQLVLGLSPLQAGLCGLPPALAMMLTAGVLMPKLATKVRPAFLIAGGLVVAATGLALLTQVGPGTGWVQVVGAMVLAVGGLAPAMTLGLNLVVGVAPPERVGAVSGLADAGNELAGALGIAILGTVGTAVYRAEMAGSATATAGESLGGAVSLGDQLPSDVLDSAIAAFTQGMQLATGAGAAVLLVVAAATAVLLRHVPHDTADATAGGDAAGGQAAGYPGEEAASPSTSDLQPVLALNPEPRTRESAIEPARG